MAQQSSKSSRSSIPKILPSPTSSRTPHLPLAIALSKAFGGFSSASSSAASSASPSPFSTPATSPMSPPTRSPFISLPLPSPPPLTPLPPLPPLSPLGSLSDSPTLRNTSPTGPVVEGIHAVGPLAGSPKQELEISEKTSDSGPMKTSDSRGSESPAGHRKSASSISSSHTSSPIQSPTPASSLKPVPSPKKPSRHNSLRGGFFSRRDKGEKSDSKRAEGRKDSEMKDRNGRRISPEILPQIELYERMAKAKEKEKEKEERWAKKFEDRFSDDLFAGSSSSKVAKSRKEDTKGEKSKRGKKGEDDGKGAEGKKMGSPKAPMAPPRPAREDDMGVEFMKQVQSFSLRALPAVPALAAGPRTQQALAPAAAAAAAAPAPVNDHARIEPESGSTTTNEPSPLTAASTTTSSPTPTPAYHTPPSPFLQLTATPAPAPHHRQPPLHPPHPRPSLPSLFQPTTTTTTTTSHLPPIPEISPLQSRRPSSTPSAPPPPALPGCNTPPLQIYLRAGSLITISPPPPPPESSAWLRRLYLPGKVPTMTGTGEVGQGMRSGSIASLDAFQGGIEDAEDRAATDETSSSTRRRSSDDKVVDEIVEFFAGFASARTGAGAAGDGGVQGGEGVKPKAGLGSADGGGSGSAGRGGRRGVMGMRGVKGRMMGQLKLSVDTWAAGELAEMRVPSSSSSSIQGTPVRMYMAAVA